MSMNIYLGSWFGVDKIVLGAGEGLLAPRVVSAAAQDDSTVRVTFDHAMDMSILQGAPIAAVLQPGNYALEGTNGHVPIVVRCVRVSDTQVDLITTLLQAVNYTLTVFAGNDTWGFELDPSYRTAVFTGIAPSYPTVADLYAFYGMYGGLQEQSSSGVSPDLTAPTLNAVDPTVSEANVPRDTTITLELTDTETGVNPGSVWLTVNGHDAWKTGAAQPGYSVVKTDITDGFRYVIDPDDDFDSYENVTVGVTAADSGTIPNVLVTSYSFRTVDTEAPYLTAHVPAPGETTVSPTASVQFDLLDAGSGVNASTVVITIGGVIGWSSDALQNGFTGTKTLRPTGFRYVLTPPVPFDPVTWITVAVYAQDQALTPNVLDTSYQFRTTYDIPPEIANRDPVHGEREVPSDKVISFDATDNVQIDEAATLIFVNDVLAYQASTPQNGFNVVVTPQPATHGYRYQVTGPAEWMYGSVVNVHVLIKDVLNTLCDSRWYFYIYEDPDCFSGPINDFELSLLVPYDYAGSKLYYTEQLRSMLIEVVTERPDPIKAIRQVFLRAFMTELAPILRNIVPTPTAKEKLAKLCYKRTAIEIDAYLRRKPGLLKAALTEMKGLGLPIEHSQLMWSYLRTDQPNDLVPLACLIVCLAKALEKNELS